MNVKFFFGLLFGLMILPVIASAAVPQFLTIQGRLTNSSSYPLTGSYVFNFSIYDALTSGNLLWSDIQNTGVIKGMWNATMGTNATLTLPFDMPYWLEIKVAGETLTPRTRIASQPYGFRANITDFIANNAKAEGTILFGGAGDTNLYRYAANILATDDNLAVNDLYGVDNDNLVLFAERAATTGTGQSIMFYTLRPTTDEWTQRMKIWGGDGTQEIDITNANLDLNSNNVTNIGYVGIGTTEPSVKLHSYGSGNLAFLQSSSGYGYLVGGNADGSVNNKYSWIGFGSNMVMFGKVNDDLVTRSEFVRIDSSGNVGIGTTAPVKKLDVVGVGNFTQGITIPWDQTLWLDSNYERNGILQVEGGAMRFLGEAAWGSWDFGTWSGSVFARKFSIGRTGNLNVNGTINFGDAEDTNLYRLTDNWLATDDSFKTYSEFRSDRTSATYPAFSGIVAGDSQARFMIYADGKIEWGDGAGARDVNLYRSAANRLATDDSIQLKGENGIFWWNSPNNDNSQMGFINFTGGSAGGRILFGTNNAEKMRLDENGRLGIGTTSPQQKLEVAGNINLTADSPSIYFHDASNGRLYTNQGMLIDLDQDNNDASAAFLGVRGGGDNYLFFINESTENIGIGTANPEVKLDVSGGYIRVDSGVQILNGGILNLLNSGNSIQLQLQNDGSGITVGDVGGSTYARIGRTGAVSYFGVNGAGNVGIGTTTPNYLLEIANNSKALNVSDTLFVNGTTGRVGIGTTTPNATLEVNGGVRLNTTTTKPTCSFTQRGTLWFEQSGGGTDDYLYACMRNSTSDYNWVLVARGG